MGVAERNAKFRPNRFPPQLSLFYYPQVDITYSAVVTVTRRDDNVYKRDSINIKYCFVLELPQKMARTKPASK